MTRPIRCLTRALGACAFAVLLASAVSAQETDIRKYALDVRIESAAHAATVRTTMTVWNPTDAPKRNLQFRINGKSEIRSVTFGGQPATFEAREDRRLTGLKAVSVTLPSAIAGRATGDIVVESRLALAAATGDALIGPGETVLLPSSIWFPMVSTPFIQYGVNTAPFSVTVTGPDGERAISGGTANGQSYMQPLYGLPFVIASTFAPPVARTAGPVALEVWIPDGSSAEMRAGADRLAADAERIIAFYSRVLGPPPACVFRIVASDGAAGFSSSSAVALGRRVFSRPQTDAETFELLADSIARIWTDGAAALRGATPGSAANRPNGVAVLRDALPRYLAILAAADRFGPTAEARAYDRARVALLRQRDAALSVQLSLITPIDGSYLGLISTKGPMVFRIFEREIGREKLLAAIASAIGAGRTSGSLTADNLRAAMSTAAGRDMTPLFKTWLDTAVLPDLIVGIPQQSGGAWTSAVRNLGTGDVLVDVVATTESGKQLRVQATVPSNGFSTARFETSERITAVEIDPERVIPQAGYANDARPPRAAAEELFADGVAHVRKKEFAAAEPLLRQAIAADPLHDGAKAWLSRALLGLGRPADAEKVAMDAVGTEPASLEALSWSNLVLGQVAMAANRPKDAVPYFQKAIAFGNESSALKASREALASARRASGETAVLDESVVKFFAEFDRTVSAGVNTQKAEQLVDSHLLPEFVRGLVTSIARVWVTEVLATDTLGRDEALADVRFTTGPADKRLTATAVVRLRRAATGWKIVDVQILETGEPAAEG
ncbi:MAG: hypothetical protein IPF53_19185 [Blastocatellia bacterium]|nr:hypothetical protein [Blastocatellia bacterium]MBK6428225.1 hypothetical protein [Blastocatellia bacterium]